MQLHRGLWTFARVSVARSSDDVCMYLVHAFDLIYTGHYMYDALVLLTKALKSLPASGCRPSLGKT